MENKMDNYLRPREEAMENIENYIIEHGLKPGDRIPAERVLCALWDYNRTTLRGAIRQLTEEGILYSKTGSGTYIAPKKLVRNLQDSQGFYSLAKSANRKVENEVLEKGFCEASKYLGRKMQVILGHKLFKLCRLRYLDDMPVLYETIYLNTDYIPGIEEYDFSGCSLYEVLKENYGMEATRGEEKLSLTRCNSDEAKYLDVEAGTPAICQSGVTRDQKDRIFECFKSITLSEYIAFGSELRRL
ncbi:GntR family transcriptional regulator [Lachnospiraceae bacterium PF1-21]|uniref:GntR family transcriptional regulator n=1 Tax=Ohessyouella blattaphilus TaxID=2949333 RepID=UPI00256AE454|nr:GntR family transcriptional regulator [Lachnospiraceae bacterium OttesenSCG-928-J05]